MFLCRVRKSLKGQAFCVRYPRNDFARTHKHNLCTVGPWLRTGFETCPCVMSRMRRRHRVQENSYC
jgi:hypothetical protein